MSMTTKLSEKAAEQLNLMLASAAATSELLQKQLANAQAILKSLSAEPSVAAALPVLEKKAPRDTSRWKLDGRYYPKGRFLLMVFKKYVAEKMALREVQEQFGSDVVFSGHTVGGNRILYQLAQDVKDQKRFHMNEKITTKDGQELVVSNQFGIENFPIVLCYLSRHLKIPLKMEDENPYSAAWKKRLES